MSADIKIQGLATLQKKLLLLPAKVGKKVVKKAARDSAKATALKAVKMRARSMVGGDLGTLMAKAGMINIRTFKRQRRGSFGLYVGFSKKSFDRLVHISKTGKRSYIPNAVEFGHGKAKAIPFMRTAFRESKAPGEAFFRKELISGTLKAFKEI